ncbi:glucagon receptor-like isoform X1 [Passer montanus]|uniref:glucagon receptor-like isoform X1 n=2 Tax=Passer montanus TaxID=9160 RepID=UPI0019603695|nr:glucagon receptor-like isoform X1 [Passer montanus]
MGHSWNGGPSPAGGPGHPREVWVPQGCQALGWHWGCHRCHSPGHWRCSPRGWQRWVEAEQAHPRREIHLHPGCSAWRCPRFWLHQGPDPRLRQPRTCPGPSPVLAWHSSACSGCGWLAEPSRPRPSTSPQDRGPRPSLRRPKALGALVRLGAAVRDMPGAGSLRSLVQLAWLCLLSSVPHGGAKVLEKTFEEWLRYRDECLRRMASEPYPAGLFCNRTFDMYACWPDGSPGTAVNVSCPFYLPWFEKVKHGLVSRRCGTDGQWVTVNGSQPWRDYSQCEDELEVTAEEEGARRLMVSFKVLYTVGYSLSLLTLISALLVLTACRNLRCTRNYIHANLFASFGLRATSVMVKDALLERRWGVQLVQVADWEALLSHEAALGCRAAQVLMQYCILANHYWFLVEAVYLYKLLIGAVFSEKNYYRLYLYLGWGTPVVFVVPWMAAKYLKENAECWALNENMAYWWIIRIPILLASLINLLIFMRILKVILAKLRANQKGYADYKLRLAKATLTLIPLFGIHEVVFIFATDEQTTGVLRYVKVFFTLFLNSFQGFLVAVLYCFANKEVKSEMKKKWQLWKLDHPVLCCAQ